MSVYSLAVDLSLRLEDSTMETFPMPVLQDSIEQAVRTMAAHLNKNYLSSLRTVAKNVEATNGELAITIANLGYNVLKGTQGIEKVKISGANGKWCTPIDMDDVKKLENPKYAGSSFKPVYYMYDNKIYISAGVTSPVVDIWFLRIPNQCVGIFECGNQAPSSVDILLTDSDGYLSSVNDTYNGAVIKDISAGTKHIVTDYDGSTKTLTVEPTGTFTDETTISFISDPWDELGLQGVDADLEHEYPDIILDFAEAECWKTDHQADRSKDAYNIGMAKVLSLNEVYEKARGIGTGNRK